MIILTSLYDDFRHCTHIWSLSKEIAIIYGPIRKTDCNHIRSHKNMSNQVQLEFPDKDLFNNIAIQPKPASLTRYRTRSGLSGRRPPDDFVPDSRFFSSDASFSNSSRFESKKRKVLNLESTTPPPKTKKSATCDICGSTFTYRQNMLR